MTDRPTDLPEDEIEADAATPWTERELRLIKRNGHLKWENQTRWETMSATIASLEARAVAAEEYRDELIMERDALFASSTNAQALAHALEARAVAAEEVVKKIVGDPTIGIHAAHIVARSVATKEIS